jgi:hypothetical protein
MNETRTVTSDEQLDRIKWLISDQQGYPIERITLDTRLQSDTGMAGDDGCDFLLRFEREFAVDMSPLRYDEHFEPEGLPFTDGLVFALVLALMLGTSFVWPWLMVGWAVALYFSFYFYFRRNARTEHAGEISVSDLLRSAGSRRWTYEYKVP